LPEGYAFPLFCFFPSFRFGLLVRCDVFPRRDADEAGAFFFFSSLTLDSLFLFSPAGGTEYIGGRMCSLSPPFFFPALPASKKSPQPFPPSDRREGGNGSPLFFFFLLISCLKAENIPSLQLKEEKKDIPFFPSPFSPQQNNRCFSLRDQGARHSLFFFSLFLYCVAALGLSPDFSPLVIIRDKRETPRPPLSSLHLIVRLVRD